MFIQYISMHRQFLTHILVKDVKDECGFQAYIKNHKEEIKFDQCCNDVLQVNSLLCKCYKFIAVCSVF